MCEYSRTLLDEYQNTFSPQCPHFWRKLSIWRQVMFELRRLIEYCDFYAIKLMKFNLNRGWKQMSLICTVWLCYLSSRERQAETGLEPWPLRCRCSASPVELSGQLGTGARFSKVPKSFRTRKAVAKSRTLWLQSCFIHILLIWTEGFSTGLFIQEVSGVYTSLFLDTD